MKKTWETPEINALAVSATASGTVPNNIPDGPVEYDKEKGTYYVTVGDRSGS